MTKPRVLIYDIENSQTVVKGWPPLYDFKVTSVKEDWYILSFAYKWHGEPDSAIKFERKSNRRGDDKALMRKLWKLYDEADAVMAHNGDRFDQRKSWTRMLFHELGPCSSYVEIDTLKLVKQKFAITSNKLDYIAKFLGIGEKLPSQGLTTWDGCEDNNPKSWDIMKRYNKHDVVLLDGVYGKIKPYVKLKLNYQNFTGIGTCVNCGSGHIIKNGWRTTAAGKKREYRCMADGCGKRSVALLADDGRLRP